VTSSKFVEKPQQPVILSEGSCPSRRISPGAGDRSGLDRLQRVGSTRAPSWDPSTRSRTHSLRVTCFLVSRVHCSQTEVVSTPVRSPARRREPVNHAMGPVEPLRGSPRTPCFKHTVVEPKSPPRESDIVQSALGQVNKCDGLYVAFATFASSRFHCACRSQTKIPILGGPVTRWGRWCRSRGRRARA